MVFSLGEKMITRKYINFLFVMCVSCIYSQEEDLHFTPGYLEHSDNPYFPMNFYIYEASINGIDMEVGDEIAVFDGVNCVGSILLESNIEQYITFVASAQDPDWPVGSGFSAGNAIVIRLWDSSDNVEITDISAEYGSGDGTYSNLGTSVLTTISGHYELGCTDENACNFIDVASDDDGSCEYCSCQTCSEHGTCVDGGANYTCTCNSFYTGTNCETDIDECATDNGGCGDATCENNEGTAPTCSELSLFNGLIPEDFNLHSRYPNPFNPVTNIIYGLPEHVNVQILVYDLSGKQIETLINQFQTPGYHSVSWNADSHPSGVYFVKIVAGDYINTQKLMLVK